MLKFLSKVKLEFNRLDKSAGACLDFLAQIKANKLSCISNPSCTIQVKYRTDNHPPQINLTYINGVEDTFDPSTTPVQSIVSRILEKNQNLETENLFRDNGLDWPVVIPHDELNLPCVGVKPRKAADNKL